MNYITECETDDYGLKNESSFYAELLKTYTSIKNKNHYNDNQLVFQIFHMSSSSGVIEPKRYLLTCVKNEGKNIVNLIDLDPNITGIDIGYVIDENDILTLYGKGSKTGAKLKLQVIYVSNIAMYQFINNGAFNNNITVTKAKNSLIRNKQCSGTNPESDKITVDKNKYSKILTFKPYWGTANGCVSFKITEIANNSLYGVNSTVYFGYNGNKATINVVNAENTRKLDYVAIHNGDLCELYIKGYDYGNLIITPITYQTGENCYVQYTISEPINEISGDVLTTYEYYKVTKPTLQNNWTEDNFYENNIIKQGNRIEVNIMCYNGDSTEMTKICDIGYSPIKPKFIPCVCLDESENMTSGLLYLNQNGELKVHKINSNKRVVCNFSMVTL